MDIRCMVWAERDNLDLDIAGNMSAWDETERGADFA